MIEGERVILVGSLSGEVHYPYYSIFYCSLYILILLENIFNLILKKYLYILVQ